MSYLHNGVASLYPNLVLTRTYLGEINAALPFDFLPEPAQHGPDV
jgi:hypothetical protein